MTPASCVELGNSIVKIYHSVKVLLIINNAKYLFGSKNTVGTTSLSLEPSSWITNAKILWTSTDSKWDLTTGIHISVASLRCTSTNLYDHLPMLLRSQLTVVGRLGRLVDKATYTISPWGVEKMVVSKYSDPSPWTEIPGAHASAY